MNRSTRGQRRGFFLEEWYSGKVGERIWCLGCPTRLLWAHGIVRRRQSLFSSGPAAKKHTVVGLQCSLQRSVQRCLQLKQTQCVPYLHVRSVGRRDPRMNGPAAQVLKWRSAGTSETRGSRVACLDADAAKSRGVKAQCVLSAGRGGNEQQTIALSPHSGVSTVLSTSSMASSTVTPSRSCLTASTSLPHCKLRSVCTVASLNL